MAVRSLFPILMSRDLPRLVGFYEDALGATVDYRFASGDEDDYVSLRARHRGARHRPRAGRADAEGDRVALWFYVDDVDAAFAAGRAGGEIVQAPADMPWGERVAQVRDPDGNLVNLGAQPVEPA